MFYRGIVSPQDRVAGLRIQSLEALPGDGEGRYLVRLLLVQAIVHSRRVSGAVKLQLEGMQDGQMATFDAAELVVPGEPYDMAYEFRYFQGLETELALPVGFEPQRMIVEIWPNEARAERINQTFEWPADRRLNDAGACMLGKKSRSQAPIGTLVGAETRVHGDIEFTGGCHVDGYVKGNVRATNDDRSVLSISERGCIEGSVVVPHVVLNGTVKGDVRATERVELGPKARVIGNVQYKLIEMSIGAEVNGKLIHESEHAAPPKASTVRRSIRRGPSTPESDE